MPTFKRSPEQKAGVVEQSKPQLTPEVSQTEREILRAPTLEQAKQTLAELAASNLIYLDPEDKNNVPEIQGSNVLIFYTRTSEIPAVEKYIKGQKKLLCDIRAIPESEYHLYGARPRGANAGESWYGWFMQVDPAVMADIKPKQELTGIPASGYQTEQNSQLAGQAHATRRPALTQTAVQGALDRYKKVNPRELNGAQASELEALINSARVQRSKRHAA